MHSLGHSRWYTILVVFFDIMNNDIFPGGRLPVAHIFGQPQSLISRLPIEMLCMIFSALQLTEGALLVPDLDVAEHRSPWQNSVRAPSWTDVMFVCRFWGEVVLACPSLWKLMINPSLEWEEECVRRSRNAPLTLMVDTTTTVGEIETDGDRAFEDSPTWSDGARRRLEELSITTRSLDQYQKLLHSLTCDPAPRLRYLCLEHIAATPRHYDVVSSPLFKGHTPNLRTLFIKSPYFQLSPKDPIFSSVTYLRIDSGAKWKDTPMSEFLTVLESWTQLRTLILQDSFPTSEVNGQSQLYPLPQPGRKVALPNLRQLRLQGRRAHHMQYFLSHISIPKSVLDLCCHVGTKSRRNPLQEQVDPAALIEGLLSHVPQHLVKSTTNLAMAAGTSSDHKFFNIVSLPNLWKKGEAMFMQDPEFHPVESRVGGHAINHLFKAELLISLRHSEGKRLDQEPKNFETIFTTLRLSHISALEFHRCYEYPKSTWVTVFKTLNNLRYLILAVQPGHAVGTLEALGEADEQGDLILPNLEHFQLMQTSLDLPTERELNAMLESRRRRSGLLLHSLGIHLEQYFDVDEFTQMRRLTHKFHFKLELDDSLAESD
ncbi:hypothetical protein EVG20_g2213 [Dentipellis fragilis]|uniref:Uncharacterized protein n=1 Tax=Dentipellis fragilis TaxID=205917 RepID=A0A4Y9ZBM6_9AGAM|nr:hypothetical protein EVG20_g2213 [Dentipellis fragilis]